MSNNGPRVSIGMPVYNSEKFLQAAIDSILSQTYTDYELIISDNASTDRTPEICQTYLAKDHRIRYFRNSHNLGATPNINKLVGMSSGEYFKWAFYDDLIAPQFLSRCIEVLDQNPSVVLCVTRPEVINENGKSFGVHEYHADTSVPEPHMRFRNYVLNYDSAFELFGLMRMSELRKTGLNGWYPGSDHVLLAELTLYGKFYVIPETLLYPRFHPAQMWISTPKERDRVVFEDTSLEGKIVLAKWGWVFGFLRSIRNAPLSNRLKLHCCTTVVRWMIKPDNFRAMGKDVVLAAQKYLARTMSKSKA